MPNRDELGVLARQFNQMTAQLQGSYAALEEKTGALGRAVEELTALGEVSRAVSSTLDLEVVLETIVARSVHISSTAGGSIYEYDEGTDTLHLRATYNMDDDLVELLRAEPIRLGEGSGGKAAATRAPVQVADIRDDTLYDASRLRGPLERHGYRALLAEYRVRDESVRARVERARLPRRILTGWQAVAGLPVFAYGYLVNALPFYVPRWLARRTARKETDYATTRFLASIVAFPLFWGVETWLVGRVFGIAWVVPFAVTLPVSGLLASRYLIGAGRLRSQLRLGALALRHGAAARQLVSERQALMAELEQARDDYLAATARGAI